MYETTSSEWWADYEKDESILVGMYHSLHLELDDEIEQSALPPPHQTAVTIQSGVNP